MKFAKNWMAASALCGGLCAAIAASTARADDSVAASTDTDADRAALDTIIVTGTRAQNRTAGESVSPIDVIGSQALQQTGYADLRDALRTLLPSFNRPGLPTGNAALTDAAQLRGLSPDDVLILINGKRRHTTANLTIQAGPQQGSAPVDLDMIPISAIDHIEVLRDGAAAQYGSDAIAGVINIILKSGKQGGSVSVDGGSYYQGDGGSVGLAGDDGFALGDRGFLHLSAEYRSQDHTDRNGIDPRSNAYDNHTFGIPSFAREAMAANLDYALSDQVDLYGFSTLTHRYGNSLQNYRFPNVAPQVWPNGFNPAETINENDFSVTAGLKGVFDQVWHWDLSTTYGGDWDSIGLIDSINTALLVPNSLTGNGGSPTTFHIGDYAIQQWTTNLDIGRAIDLGLASPLNLSFGGEYRRDGYQVEGGDAASYFGSGAQAKAGLNPVNNADQDRESQAVYVELSQNLGSQWSVDLAGRYEHYSDFGGVPIGKFSTRYDFTPNLAWRFTANTGFRAPSLAQEYYSAVSVTPSGASGQLAANSPGTRLLGAPPLKPERSTNYSTGLVVEPLENLHFALDVYQILIRDRIVDAGGSYSGTQTAANALLANGINIAGLPLSGLAVQYFANGVATRTRGMDLTADYLTELGAWGRIDWDFAANVNHTSVLSVGLDGNGVPLLNAQGISYISTDSPHDKVVLGGVWRGGPWHVSLHEVRYGSSVELIGLSSFKPPATGTASIANPGTQVTLPGQFYRADNSPRYVTDLEVGYDLRHDLHWVIGAENLFDAYPARLPLAAAGLGSIYATNTGLGINGGRYYTRLTFDF